MGWGGGGWLGEAKALCILRHGVSNWYWLRVGQGLLCLQQVRVKRGNVYISSVSLLSFFFLFRLCPTLSSPLLSLLSLFFLSLGDDTKWPTRVDLSCRKTPTQSINQITSKQQWSRSVCAYTESEKVFDVCWYVFRGCFEEEYNVRMYFGNNSGITFSIYKNYVLATPQNGLLNLWSPINTSF